MYTVHTLLTLCVLIFDKADKPKQNGSADGEDAVQGSKQSKHVCRSLELFLMAS